MHSRTSTTARAVVVAVVAVLTLPLLTATSVASGLRNDYVVAADGDSVAITAFNKTRTGDGVYVYEPSWGSSTQQNQWGAEAVVEDGHIASLTAPGQGGNARIPSDGYTISGYGTGASWMTAHLHVGDAVSVERDVIRDTTRSVTTVVDKVDPAPPFEFPGGRGANETVAYTSAYGYPTTGTNQYGTEAVAEPDGDAYRVVSVGGNDSAIPEDGLVVSAHGTEMAWLQTNVVPGTLLRLDPATRELTATTDATSYLYLAERAIERAAGALEDARAAYADAPLDRASTRLDEARDQLAEATRLHEAGEDRASIETSDATAATAEEARQLTIESDRVETRAVWHRPQESSPAEVEATVAAMADAGINQLYLETFWGGRTIYPSDLAEQNTHFTGWDPLAEYVAAAKRHDINLHLWMHTFYVGTDAGDGSGNGSPVAQDHPEWLVVDRAGRTKSVTEPGYYFIDPAVPEGRQWLLDLFTESTTRYDVAGLQLDYIRYPKQGSGDTVSSYNAIARAAYEDEHGVDPLDLVPGTPAYQEWFDWETEQVSSFVRDARDELDDDLVLSSALETNDNEVTKNDFHQDFEAWVRDGLLDTVVPEVYTAGTSDVAERSVDFVRFVGDDALSSIGIAPAFVGAPPPTTVDQVVASRDSGATGVSQFVWKSITADVQEALARSVYREPALDPQEDPVGAVAALAADLQRRVRTVYAPGLSTATQQRLTAELRGVASDVDKDKLAKVAVRLDRVERLLGSSGVPAGITDRGDRDVRMMHHLLDVAAPAGWPVD